MSIIRLVPGETYLIHRSIPPRSISPMISGFGVLDSCAGLNLMVSKVDTVRGWATRGWVTLTAKNNPRDPREGQTFKLPLELVTDHYFDILRRVLTGVFITNTRRNTFRSPENTWHQCDLNIQLSHQFSDVPTLTFEVNGVELAEHEGELRVSNAGLEKLRDALRKLDREVRFDSAFVYVVTQTIKLFFPIVT